MDAVTVLYCIESLRSCLPPPETPATVSGVEETKVPPACLGSRSEVEAPT